MLIKIPGAEKNQDIQLKLYESIVDTISDIGPAELCCLINGMFKLDNVKFVQLTNGRVGKQAEQLEGYYLLRLKNFYEMRVAFLEGEIEKRNDVFRILSDTRRNTASALRC